jgi:hypothetical protein
MCAARNGRVVTVSIVDRHQRQREEEGALARTAAGRLLALYLTYTGQGAEPESWRRAAAGAIARTVPVLHDNGAFSELNVLVTRLVPAVDWAVDAWRSSTDRLIGQLCPTYCQDAAYDVVGQQIEAAVHSPGEAVDLSTKDLRGAMHGLAASAAVRIAARGVGQAAALETLPGVAAPWDAPAALSAYLREEWRRRVDIMGWWQACVEHEYMSPIPGDVGADLSAVVEDLRLLAPASADAAPAEWPGGWVLHHVGRNVHGRGGRVAWPTDAGARAAVAELAPKGPFDVVWAPFAMTMYAQPIVLDAHHWNTPGGGTELGT